MIHFSSEWVGGWLRGGGVVNCTNQKEEIVLVLALKAAAVQLEVPAQVLQQGTVSPQDDVVTPVALGCLVLAQGHVACITCFSDM